MAGFTARQAAAFDRVYKKADEEDGGLMVKFPFCKTREGCHPDQCEYLIGMGDGIEWQGDFAILHEMKAAAAELYWGEDDQHDKLFAGIRFWRDISPGQFEDMNYLIKDHPYIKIHGMYWEGIMISGNFEYAFINHMHREKCLSDMREVLQRLQEAVVAGQE